MPTIRQCDVPPEVWKQLQAAAGIVPKPKRKAPSVRTASACHWSITLTLGCRVVSEANRRDYWSVKARRVGIQCEALSKALKSAGLTDHVVPLPVVVTWVRVGVKVMDDDNLANAFKGLRDCLAKWLGVDDGDTAAVRWRYEQRVGEAGVVVTIQSRAGEGG